MRMKIGGVRFSLDFEDETGLIARHELPETALDTLSDHFGRRWQADTANATTRHPMPLDVAMPYYGAVRLSASGLGMCSLHDCQEDVLLDDVINGVKHAQRTQNAHFDTPTINAIKAIITRRNRSLGKAKGNLTFYRDRKAQKQSLGWSQ